MILASDPKGSLVFYLETTVTINLDCGDNLEDLRNHVADESVQQNDVVGHIPPLLRQFRSIQKSI